MIGATSGSDFLAGVSETFMTDTARVPDSFDDFGSTTAGINSVMIKGFKKSRGAKQGGSAWLTDSNFSGATLGVIKLMNYASEDTYSLTVLGEASNLKQVIYSESNAKKSGWTWSPGDSRPSGLASDVPLNVVAAEVVV